MPGRRPWPAYWLPTRACKRWAGLACRHAPGCQPWAMAQRGLTGLMQPAAAGAPGAAPGAEPPLPPPVAPQVHLSHNMLTLRGAAALLEALPVGPPAAEGSTAEQAAAAHTLPEEASEPGPAADAAGTALTGAAAGAGERPVAPAPAAVLPSRPCWLRMEWNRISLEGLMQARAAAARTPSHAAHRLPAQLPSLRTLSPQGSTVRHPSTALALLSVPSCSGLRCPAQAHPAGAPPSKPAGAGIAACAAWPGCGPALRRARRRHPKPARPAGLPGGRCGDSARAAHPCAGQPWRQEHAAAPGRALPRAHALGQVSACLRPVSTAWPARCGPLLRLCCPLHRVDKVLLPARASGRVRGRVGRCRRRARCNPPAAHSLRRLACEVVACPRSQPCRNHLSPAL